MRYLIGLIACSLLLGIHCEQNIAPTDANIQYIGRFDKDDDTSYKFSWPGSEIRFTTDSTSVSAKLSAEDSYVYVIMNGETLTEDDDWIYFDEDSDE
jgi:hypothetical protein